MTRTLFIYGALAPRACRAEVGLSRGLGEVFVLEAETWLPVEERFDAGAWINALDIFSPEDQVKADRRTDDVLETYLRDFPMVEGVPLHRAFRAACLGMTCRKWINPYLVNLEMARRVFEGARYDRLVVAPGAGISFRAWRQVAEQHGLPVVFLAQEPRPWSLKRRWQRLVNRWKKKPAPVAAALQGKPGGQQATVLCCSIRLSRMLQGQAESSGLDWAYVSDELLGKPEGAEFERLKSGYSKWWQKCANELRALLKDNPGDPRSILLDLGEGQSRDTYPRFAWKYLRARDHLAQARPRLLLCDTQEGSDERAWSLAASELGIPVAAYTYDHIPQPRFSFSPDWLLCDSGRNAYIAQLRGHQADRIVPVASHRRPTAVLKERSGEHSKILLYADSYYSGTSATVEPQRSYLHYRLLVETARQMPGHQFHLKFHPLRDRKKVEQCFIGMDEDELYVRMRYIESLNPPPNVKMIPPEEDMLVHLQKAGVLLNSNSTAGLEAFVLGVPVIFLYEPNTELGFPLIHEHGACLVATTSDSLAAEVARLENDPAHAGAQIRNQRRYVDEFYWSSGRQSLTEGIQAILRAQTAAHIASTGTAEAGP
jgi:hypothetical protein